MNFFLKISYKILFTFSILLGLISLFGSLSGVPALIKSYEHGLLSIIDVVRLFFPLSLLLMFISLFVITRSYLRNQTKPNRISNICVVIILLIIILVLTLLAFSFFLLTIGAGIFTLLVLSGFTILPPSVTVVATIVFFLAFIGLVATFTKQRGVDERRSSFLLWLFACIATVMWFAPQFIKDDVLLFSQPTIAVTIMESKVNWSTYENQQIGISFKYPPSLPSPEYYGIDGYGNPDFTIQGFDIEIGQKKGDGRTCYECIPMSLDESIKGLGEYLINVSPDFKKSTIILNGRNYPVFTSVSGEVSKDSIIFIPNKPNPNDFAVLTFKGALDQQTIYSIIDSFRFIEKKKITEYVDEKIGYRLTAPTGFVISTSWEGLTVSNDKEVFYLKINADENYAGNWEKFGSLSEVLVGNKKANIEILKLRGNIKDSVYILLSIVKLQGNSYSFTSGWFGQQDIKNPIVISDFSKLVSSLEIKNSI